MNWLGRWWLIVDLYGIDEPELCFLSYTSVDVAVKVVRDMGWKFNLKSLTLRLDTVYPDDKLLLHMVRKGMLYIDTTSNFKTRGTSTNITLSDIELDMITKIM